MQEKKKGRPRKTLNEPIIKKKKSDKKRVSYKSEEGHHIEENTRGQIIKLNICSDETKNEHDNGQFLLNSDLHPDSSSFLQDQFKLLQDNTEVNTQTLLCWWCCHNIEPDTHIGIPIKIDNEQDFSRNKLIQDPSFSSIGYFCSFGCLKAYIESTPKYAKNIHLPCNVVYLYKLLTTKDVSYKDIKSSPPKETLKSFGGKLSIEEFRNSCKNDIVYKILPFPMISYETQIDTQSFTIQSSKKLNPTHNIITDYVTEQQPSLVNNTFVCEETNCKLIANYNYVNSSKPLYCKNHMRNKMVYIASTSSTGKSILDEFLKKK